MSSRFRHWAACSIALAACSGSDVMPGHLPSLSAGAGGGWTTSAGAPSAGVPAAGSGGAPLTSSSAGSPVLAAGSGAAGSGAVVAGSGGAAGGHTQHMAAGSGGMGATMSQAEQHCRVHGSPDPRDEMLTGEPLVMNVGVDKDLLVPQLVLNWMDEQEFAQSHDGWHLVRKWDQSCRKSNSPNNCAGASRLVAQGLSRAPIQQGAPGDGVAFMMMHRHMIQMLKATFPKHAELFSGFKKIPKSKDDPNNPAPWRAVNWTSSNLKGFDILENIEQHLDQFPTEDDLGGYIQNTYKWTEQSPMSPVNAPGSGLHGALHAQWSVNGSPANLIQQAVDVKNFTFWKLHGWIDDVWQRYRVAKNMKEDDPAYQKLLYEQCMEMYALQPRNRKMSGTPGGPTAGSGGSGAAETGVFATMVRPMFDSTCAGCHSAIAPSAGMTLGGAGISSAEVRMGLVGVKATNGEYALIEPGMPQKSWVYLKASGGAATATCTSACDRESMPPSGSGLTAAQLTTLRQWIENGATDR